MSSPQECVGAQEIIDDNGIKKEIKEEHEYHISNDVKRNKRNLHEMRRRKEASRKRAKRLNGVLMNENEQENE